MLRLFSLLSLFDGLKEHQLRLLESLFEAYHCLPETVIFQQGEPAEFLYLLLEGEVAIRYKPYDGETITITQVRPGGVFGWSAVVGSASYTSGAVALNECHALRVRGRDLVKLSRQYPDLGETMLSRLADLVASRWQNAQSQVRSLLHKGLNLSQPALSRKERKMVSDHFSKEQHLKGLVENLSAYIEHFHGGSVEFVSFDGKVLKVRLGGACLGCPLSPATLHGWVEGTIHQFFPNVKVEQV
ncbi:MAG: cyclic nucleotide-binding domain-containing protein [Anaerolineales bacterium]